EFATEAGLRADGLLAFEDAVQFFQAALDALEQRGTTDEPRRSRLLFLLGDALRKSADLPRAQATLREAAALSRRLGLFGVLAQAALAYERTIWRTERPTDRPPEQLLFEALRLVPERETALRIELMGGLARALLHAGAVAEARKHLATAIALARELGDPGLL